ncbi:MAG TPA: hypothetical protein VF484_01575 [Candidatus Limnocylindrales bacterium]
MDWLLVLFRLTHVPAAIIWAGSALFVSFYVEPAIQRAGPNAQPLVDMMDRTSAFFAIAATLTVIGGSFLYIHDAGGLQLWTSTSGLVFTLGAVCGILAWAAGFTLILPTVKRIAAVGAEMKAAGGPPSADLVARMAAAQHRLKRIGQVDTILILVAILAMATARYFV